MDIIFAHIQFFRPIVYIKSVRILETYDQKKTLLALVYEANKLFVLTSEPHVRLHGGSSKSDGFVQKLMSNRKSWSYICSYASESDAWWTDSNVKSEVFCKTIGYATGWPVSDFSYFGAKAPAHEEGGYLNPRCTGKEPSYQVCDISASQYLSLIHI